MHTGGPPQAEWPERLTSQADLKHMKTLIRSKAERGPGSALSMLEKDTAGSDVGDRPRQLPKRVRGPRMHAAGRQADSSQDLVLAVCLSVFITFFQGFLPGAYTRPYMDRLWQQRCRKKKSPGSALGNEYSNQAFYDEIEGAVKPTAAEDGSAPNFPPSKPL